MRTNAYYCYHSKTKNICRSQLIWSCLTEQHNNSFPLFLLTAWRRETAELELGVSEALMMGVATPVVGSPVWVPNDDGAYVAAVVKRLEEGGAVLVAKPAARGLAELKVVASTAVPIESGCTLVPKRLANTVKGQWRVVLDRKVNVEETNQKVCR